MSAVIAQPSKTSFASFIAATYSDPAAMLMDYFDDLASFALGYGAVMEEPPLLETKGYLANLAGKRDQKQGYWCELVRDKDGIFPTVTINSFKGGGSAGKWNPRDALWQRYKAAKDGGSLEAFDAQQLAARRAAAEIAIKAAEARKAERERLDAIGRDAGAVVARDIWEAATECTGHAYLAAKDVKPFGLRVALGTISADLWDTYEGAFVRSQAVKAGDLLIPLSNADGVVVNLQRINSKGEKLFLTGARKKGTAYRIEGTEPALIAEGYATAATVHAATGQAVYVGLDAGNLAAVVDSRPGKISAVAADNDKPDSKGKCAGETGAQATGLPFAMPPTVDQDWNDYAASNGLEAVAAELVELAGIDIDAELAAIADQLGETEHKLARYVEIGDTPKPSSWLLPGFIAEGVAMLAGGHGAGKTTTILPMSLAVAGVHPKDYALAPDHWRHVIYITEDTHQAQRIICGYGEWLDWPGGRGIPQTIKERLHLVEARRSSAGYVAAAGSIYREQFTRTITVNGVDGLERTVELLPLVVIDTLAATIEMENENDNSEASAAIAALKQQFAGLPIWIVGHTAKANMSRSDTITARGASAWEADANQVLYLVRDDKDQSRWLVRGKTRFESPWPELEIKSNSSTKTVLNQFGQEEELTLRWSIPMPPEQSRTDRSAQKKAEHAERDREALRWGLLNTLTDAFKAGERLNRTALKSRAGGRSENTSAAIAEQIADGWIYEVEIPKSEQLRGKQSFLVALSEAEREEFQRTGVIPEYLLEIPPSWKKPPKEPKSENGNEMERHDENEEDF